MRFFAIFCILPGALSFTTVTTSSSRSLSSLSTIPSTLKPTKLNHKTQHSSLYYPTTLFSSPDFEDNLTRMTSSHFKRRKRDVIQGVHPFLQRISNKIQSEMKKPTHKAVSLIAAAFLMLAVIFTPLSEALAAPSGGRMGGSFGGGSSRSSSSYSRSYSSPSRSYSRGFSQGYSTGYYSRPSITVAPVIGPRWGYGYSPYAGGVTVVSRGPGLGEFLFFGIFALAAYNIFTSANNVFDESSTMSALGEGVTVASISVALNVPDKHSPSSILTYLNRLSQTARTDSRVGVSNLVSQVALELLRQKRSIFAASSKFSHYQNGDKAQRDFSSRAIEERSKFERESINKYGGVDYSQNIVNSRTLQGDLSYSPKATAAVVTIIVAIDGDSTKLPIINSAADLDKALMKIATDVKVDNCLRSAEVLWTPEDIDDTLSQREVIVDYPELRNI